MIDGTSKITVETIYGHIWSEHGRRLFAQLDKSLNPRSPKMLYNITKHLGVDPHYTVLDIGCGVGTYAYELAQRFGCHVVGIDPVINNLEQARSRLAKGEVGELITLQQGTIEAIPCEDLTFDLIWCSDMLTHVYDLRQGIQECVRVLKYSGNMIIYTMFATALLEIGEAEYLYKSLGIMSENMSSTYVEDIFNNANLQVLSREVIGGEWMEYLEESEGLCSKELLRIARMKRVKNKILASHGKEIYDISLASCYWHVYQLLGKLTPVIYVCKKC